MSRLRTLPLFLKIVGLILTVAIVLFGGFQAMWKYFNDAYLEPVEEKLELELVQKQLENVKEQLIKVKEGSNNSRDPLNISGAWYYQVYDEHGHAIRARNPKTKKLEKKFLKIKGSINISPINENTRRYIISGDRTELIGLDGQNVMEEGQKVTLDFQEVDYNLSSTNDLAFKFSVMVGSDLGFVRTKIVSDKLIQGYIHYLYADYQWQKVKIEFSRSPF